MSAPAAFSDIAKAANDVCFSLPNFAWLLFPPGKTSTIQPDQTKPPLQQNTVCRMKELRKY